MLKKKNMAIMMAVATVATTVAPAFAAVETTKVDEATLIAKVQEMLNTKYTDSKEDGLLNSPNITVGNEYMNSVYTIKNVATNNDIKSISQLKALIEDAKVNNTELVLTITDKGHRTVNGSIVAEETTKYDYYADVNADLTTAAAALTKAGATVKAGATNTEGTIVLKNGTEINLVAGDYKLDLARPVDANGNAIDAGVALTDSMAKQVAGFEKFENATATTKDVASKEVGQLSFNGAEFVELQEKASDIIVDNQYTKYGAEFINGMIDTKTAGNTIVKDGVKYNFTRTADPSAVEVAKDGGYKFEITLKKSEVSAAVLPATDNVKITVAGASQKDLNAISNAIIAGTEVVDIDGKMTKVSGETRFDTAVEVSKKAYTVDDSADAVVLVGENAIVDGLAAAPLAAEKNAPILLSKKDAVTTETMNEIKRAAKTGCDIYLVGGEDIISKQVEAQLIKEMNAHIIRVAGDDRFATSLEISKKLTNKTNAFVVGGDGLADAMSIASLAATTKTPIIVSPAAGLTKDEKTFLETNTGAIKVVGGESRVSTQVLKDIKAANAANIVTRIAGEDRSETNAKVIATLTNLDNVYVAKDGNNALVDALAAAPLAAKNNGAIVLATNDLTQAQQDAVTSAKKVGTKLNQVGDGVGANAIQKLINLLKL